MSALPNDVVLEEFEGFSGLRLIQGGRDEFHVALGRPVSERLARRQAMLRRRRVALVVVAIVAAATLLVTGGAGASNSASNAEQTIAPGTTYVVQAGSTVASIAAAVDPSQPTVMMHELERELRSDVVLTGERIQIP